MDTFDELYVVSDLHIGGVKSESVNFQIFKEGKCFAAHVNKFSEKTTVSDMPTVL